MAKPCGNIATLSSVRRNGLPQIFARLVQRISQTRFQFVLPASKLLVVRFKREGVVRCVGILRFC